MQRRNFLKTSAAALAAQAAFGQTSAKLKIDCYSRHLQWLRNADDVAEAAAEMGFEGLDITVRTYPGHVDPAKVAADLPPFVNAVRKHGLQVTAITTNIADADSPYAEDILRAASQAGITHYWWGTYRYDGKTPVMQQLDALKPRVAKLAALNAKYKMKAMYHTYSGNVQVGSALWDMLYVMREFDPAHISFHYDTGHQTNAGGNGTWSLGMRAAGPYIGGISVKDSVIEPTFVSAGGGGPMENQPNVNTNERGGGAPPAAGAAGAAGGRAQGGGQGQGQRQGGGGQGGQRPAPAAQNAGAPPAGAGGQGGRQDNMPGWRVRQTPLGTGSVNLALFSQILKEINFSGPLEIQSEYPLGGADNAQDKITLPRAIVLGAMKRDRLVLKQALVAAGLA